VPQPFSKIRRLGPTTEKMKGMKRKRTGERRRERGRKKLKM